MRNKIKLHFSSLLLVMLLSITGSCKDDDEQKPRLVGKWTQFNSEIKNCEDPNMNEKFYESCSAQLCFSITFNADKSFIREVLMNGEVTADYGSYALSAGQLEMCITDSNCVVYALAKSHNVIQLTSFLELGCEYTQRFARE